MLEPDEIDVRIEMPEIFISAESLEPLSTEPIEFRIPIGAQYTIAEFTELK